MGLGNLGADLLSKLTAAAPSQLTDDQIDALLAGINPSTGQNIPGGTPAAILTAATAEYNKRVKAGTWRKATAAAPAAKASGFPVAKIAIFAGIAIAGILVIKKMKG
jgi:hypothetical protein